MASEHDILSRLPEAPAPAPDARDAAIANALERFEKKNLSRAQGNDHDLRLTQQTAASNSPSRRRPLMPRTRQLVAASLVAVMAGSATWFYVNETSVVRLPDTIVDQPSNTDTKNKLEAAQSNVSPPPVVQSPPPQSSPPQVLDQVAPKASPIVSGELLAGRTDESRPAQAPIAPQSA